MKKVLVLGATGFVGLHVCEKLVRAGWQVSVITRRRSNARDIMLLPGLTVLEMDVHDEAALSHALVAQDAVVNLVAVLHGTQAVFEQVHVALPQKLARACVDQKVAKVVHISAMGADALQPDKAPSMYLQSKGEGEAVLIQAANALGAGATSQTGFDLSIIRPSVIFGAEDKFINVFAQLQKVLPFVPLASAKSRFQPVWVEDVAAAVVALLQGRSTLASPRTYEACGPEVFTLQQLVRLAGQVSGLCGGWGRPVIAMPMWVGRLQAAMMSLAPGVPLMSADNLDSMRVDNVSQGHFANLQALGITPSALEPIVRQYLR